MSLDTNTITTEKYYSLLSQLGLGPSQLQIDPHCGKECNK